MNHDLLARRRQLAGMALALLVLLSLPNCGGGSGQGSSDIAATSTNRVVDADAVVIAPVETQQAGAPVDGSAWGAAPSSALSREPEAWLPAMAEAGVGSVRNFHDPPGDDKLSPILAAGMTAVGILQWSPRTPPSLPADDLDGWRRYVSEEVSRHKGRVKYWEIWNEPPNFTEDRSPASYAKVVAAAYEAAKAVDPQVQLGLAAKSNHVNWLAETIAAGAADKFDFVTLHPYEVGTLLPQGWEGQFMSIVPRVRKMLQQRSPARAQVPVWFTEIGISAAPPPGAGNVGPQVQADVLVKIHAMAFAQGVRRVYWFDPRDSEGLSMGLTAADGSKRPAWQALRSMRSYLGAQPRYAGWLQPDNAWYGFVFDGPQGVVLVAWTRPGESASLPLGPDVLRIDPRTGVGDRGGAAATLTEAPVLLVAPAASSNARQWLADAASNSVKPFPWNGDHSASASVQLTAGQLPAGVFIANPPAVTMAGQRAEFDMEGTIGACFAVDPTFVSYAYEATPLRITAQVRGHGSGDPGFELRYESTAPIAATDGNNLKLVDSGWFRIRGSSVREKTWQLPDARFVGLYGYHFCFYAPMPDNARFSILQVTVRR